MSFTQVCKMNMTKICIKECYPEKNKLLFARYGFELNICFQYFHFILISKGFKALANSQYGIFEL